MYVGFLLTIASLFLFSGCSHSSKHSAQSSSAPTAAPTATAAATPPAASPQAPAAEKKAEMTVLDCKRDAETRSLEIETLSPKGCKLWYSKDGGRNSVASSSVGTSHCENVQSRIRGKLEEAQFACAPRAEAAAKK